MAKTQNSIGEVYASRATESEPPARIDVSVPRVREPRDMVYGGTGSFANPASSSQKRPASKRKASPLNVMVILIGAAVAIVLYISNIIAVGQLLNEVNELRQKHQRTLNEQEILRAQINKMSSLDRIRKLAEDQLGLKNPKDVPVWLAIDPERVKEINESIHRVKKPVKKK